MIVNICFVILRILSRLDKLHPCHVPINDTQLNDLSEPLFKIGHIGFLVQKDAQCSKTYEKSIFWFLRFFFWDMVDFLPRILSELVTLTVWRLRLHEALCEHDSLGPRELWSKIGRIFTSRIKVSNFAGMFVLGYFQGLWHTKCFFFDIIRETFTKCKCFDHNSPHY